MKNTILHLLSAAALAVLFSACEAKVNTTPGESTTVVTPGEKKETTIVNPAPKSETSTTTTNTPAGSSTTTTETKQ